MVVSPHRHQPPDVPHWHPGVQPYTEPIPEPRPGFSLCSSPLTPDEHAHAHAHPVTSAAACLAAKYRIVLVANYLDRENCSVAAGTAAAGSGSGSDCPPDGVRMFNTAVAFDEGGALIAKYHKHRCAHRRIRE